ncbi:D-2-hydroxyacid dehydrogenase [Fulvivirga sp. RKSG066]|uniref:NAD(P)-dependent oxidoreductase n=1 Tax=Fulvivirga aurantia TaxID=2529383 RepID=UPI0012BCE263|nr:NAD(P)-dependent oxidoreductase [Fulvivirga aurantia]MTI22531.1 D-2-hydroxyacid dehydrogenase [Fulvivirga aurantia]
MEHILESTQFASIGRLANDFKSIVESLAVPGLTCTVYESEDELAKNINQHNALAAFTVSDHVDISGIKWIHSFGAGVDGFVQRKDLNPNVLLTRTAGNMGKRMAEYCLAYILNDLKAINQSLKNQQKNSWEPLQIGDLYEQKVLVFGTGTIGGAIADSLAPMVKQLVCVNRSGTSIKHQTVALSALSNLEAYDIIINALPLTSETTAIFNRLFFSKCTGALFINVGRGESVVDLDLLSALNKSQLRGAVLDVFHEEPLPSSHAFWSTPNLLVTPHHASKTNKKDLQESFSQVLKSIRNGDRSSPLFVDIKRGY